MLRKSLYYATVMGLLCLMVAVSGCSPPGSARAVAVEEPASALTTEQDGAGASVEPAPDEQADEPQPLPPAEEGVHVVSAFEAANGELPEGIAIDKRGNIYVTVGYPFFFPVDEGFGQIWKIGPEGERTVLHEFPGGPGAAGLALSPSGELYFAYPNPADPATNGVYRLMEGHEPQRFPGSENIGLANGLALGTGGYLFASDSVLGAVWRIPDNGDEAGMWLQHEWLTGCDSGDYLIGANGVAFWRNSLYVASSSRGMLLRVPILRDGSAGEPKIVAGDLDCDMENDELYSMDGIALDVHGNIFALLVLQNKLVRIDPRHGSHAVHLTAEDGLYNPASIAFGSGERERQSVFLSNFALLPPEPPGSLGPGVLSYDVGVPGQPLP